MTPYYAHDGIVVYHGDCREVLPAIDVPADAIVVADPPYGINHQTSHGASWQGTIIANDHSTELRDWMISFLAPRPMAVFGTWKAPRPKGLRAVLIWDKGPAFGMGDLAFPWKNSFEEIYVIGDGWVGRRDEGVLRGHMVVSWESHGRSHPHEKPVTLLGHIIAKHKAETIVDPTCGTGATLRAAKDHGRKGIGIEVDERYCEITAQRLSQQVLPLGNG